MKSHPAEIVTHLPQLVGAMHKVRALSATDKKHGESGSKLWAEWEQVSSKGQPLSKPKRASTMPKLVRLTDLADISEPDSILDRVELDDVDAATQRAISQFTQTKRSTREVKDSIRKLFRAEAGTYFPEWKDSKRVALHERFDDLLAWNDELVPYMGLDEKTPGSYGYLPDKDGLIVVATRQLVDSLLKTAPHSDTRKKKFTTDAAFLLSAIGDLNFNTWLRTDIDTSTKEKSIQAFLRWSYKVCLLEKSL